MVVRKFIYMVFLLLTAITANVFAQQNNERLILEIQSVCDSLLDHKIKRSKEIGAHMVFLAKINNVANENTVTIKKLYNLSALNYHDFSFISNINNCIVLYEFGDTTLINQNTSNNINKINIEHLKTLENRLNKSENGYIHSREMPYYFVFKNNTLQFVKFVDDFVDKPDLLKPVKIEKIKW